MTQTVVALIALAALVSAVQWAWVRLAGHVDLRLVPVTSRRRAQWLLAHSARVQYCSVAVVSLAVVAQGIYLVG